MATFILAQAPDANLVVSNGDQKVTVTDLITQELANHISHCNDTPDVPVSRTDSVAYAKAFVLTANGNILRRPRGLIVEGDEVYVAVVAPKRLHPLFRVRQLGSAGAPDVVRYFGGPPAQTLLSDAAGGGAEVQTKLILSDDTTCSPTIARLGDFPPGGASFALTAAVAGTEMKLTEVPFSVARRYSGTLTFGAVYSGLDVPSYRLDPIQSDSLDGPARLVEEERHGAHVVAGFAPVLLGPRPIMGGVLKPRLDGFFGIAVDDPFNNFYGGLSLNLNGVLLLNVGLHLGSVESIPASAALRSFEEVPAGTDLDDLKEEEWRVGTFIGISIDAASATAAFGSSIRGLLGTSSN